VSRLRSAWSEWQWITESAARLLAARQILDVVRARIVTAMLRVCGTTNG
jgi:hypothetical protein